MAHINSFGSCHLYAKLLHDGSFNITESRFSKRDCKILRSGRKHYVTPVQMIGEYQPTIFLYISHNKIQIKAPFIILFWQFNCVSYFPYIVLSSHNDKEMALYKFPFVFNIKQVREQITY